jgi:hypothetical protein
LLASLRIGGITWDAIVAQEKSQVVNVEFARNGDGIEIMSEAPDKNKYTKKSRNTTGTANGTAGCESSLPCGKGGATPYIMQ